MIYDCFLFNNELDILEIRLHELDGVVDKFVLVESTVSHVNKPKPLYFKKNMKRFSKFKNKIIHVVVEDSPDVNLAWIINDYQFSQISRGLTSCEGKDIIIFGDLDEIPRAKKILEYRDKPGKLKIFEQTLSFYYLNFIEYSKGPWLGTRMTTYANFSKYKTPWIAKFSKIDLRIPDGGWHFSYMGGAKKIQQKLTSMAHQEFNNDKFNTREHIIHSIRKHKDFMGLGNKFKVGDISILPQYVFEHRDKFRDLLITESNDSKLNAIPDLYLFFKKQTRVIFRRVRRKIRNQDA